MLLIVALILTMAPVTAFAETTDQVYTKVTDEADLTSGQYVLVTDTGYAPGVLDGTWVTAVKPEVIGDTITNPAEGIWTITVDENGAILKDANGTSVAPKGGNNNGIKSGGYQWEVKFTDGKASFLGTGTDTVVLASNSDKQYENKFRAYKSTTVTGYPDVYPSEFTLYKLTASGGSGDEGDVTAVAAPTAVPQAGEVEAGSPVTLTTATEGAVIYYTTDGSQPTAESTLYSGPITIFEETTIKAIAVKDGVSSAVQTLKYTIASVQPSASAEKVTSIAQLDKVYIYNISAKEVLTSTTSGKKLAGAAATVEDDKLTVAEGMEELIVAVDGNGCYSFLTADGKYLTSGATGNSLTFAEEASDYSLWTLADTEDGNFYIKNVNAVYNGTVQALEYYSGFTTYGFKESNDAYKFAFFKSGVAEELPGSAEEEDEISGDYVIWAPAYNKALSSNYGGSYYNPGVDVTETNGVLSGYGNSEIWTVTKNTEDDTYYISCSDGKLSMDTDYSSMPLDKMNDKWTLKDAGNGLYYVKNTGRNAYIEWYAAKSYWSGYGNIAEGSEGMFALKFTPVEKQGYDTDASVVANIAQWGGGGPYDDAANATAIQGDKYVSGDMLDTAAKFTIMANGATGKPFQTSKSTTTGGTNYYMGGENIGKAEGDYMQFAVNTAGYGDMTLSFRLRATNAAPGTFQLQYSIDDGQTFRNFTTGEYSYAYTQYTSEGSYPVTGSGQITDGIAKPSLAPTNYVNFSFDVPEGAEIADNLLIRLVAGTERASGTGSISGNVRIDSVVLAGSPIVDNSVTGYVTVTPDGEEDQPVGTELTMASATEGAVISYRFVDQSTGLGDWKTYQAEEKPVLEALPATLEVKASCEGKADSITRILNYAAGTVSRVKMSPNGGGVYIEGESADVTLSCETEGATIYYLVDDAESFTEYTAPITLEKGFSRTVIQAYAVKDGFKDSALITRTFTERTNATYNIYFGQLHSHTSYSDGAGTAAEAFKHASNVDNLDFLALTDHSNSYDNAESASITDGSMSTEWVEGHALAKQYTTDKFVGLFGYEMTWSNGLGHMNTFNTPGFQSRTQSAYSTYATALQNYYSTLKTVPDSISQFNHPGTTFGDFSDFGYYDEEIDQLITTVEVGNGEGTIGSSGYFPSYAYYTRALDKGWHVAPTNNQDNHKGLWGDANTARSVVLADDLTEESIYDAMRNYRVYATEDNDLSIWYTLDDNLMGSILEKDDVGDTVDLEAVLNDPTDFVGKVEVIVNGGLSIAKEEVNGNSDTVNFTVPSNYSYYYIKVTEKDGDIAVTAPIWVGKVEAAGISGFTTDAPLPVQGEALDLKLDLYNNEKTPLEIEEITFTIGDEVIHTADLTNLKEIGKMSTASYTFSYSHDGIGKTEIYANVKGSRNGVEKVYKEALKLTYVKSDMVTRVIVDGTHYNDYVAGYYGGNMNNFTSIAAESQVEVKVVKDEITAEMLKDCSLLVISAPAKKSGTANAGAYVAKPFENDFINMVADYVKAGGSVIVCGLADYQDKGAASADNHTAAQMNKLLEAIGSTMKINDDEAYDEENNGGQAYRLYPTTFNTDSKWVEGILDGQKYSQYSGCTVDPGDGTWLIKGFDTTYSIDSDKDGSGGVEKGSAVFMACEDTQYGGTIFTAGGVFLSDFEVKAELDNIWDLPYANRTIAENILDAVRVELPLSTIAEMRQGNMDDVFRIQGYTTSSRKEGNAFFDAIYLQDNTAGVTVFPMAEDGLELGVKMEITGYVDAYQGDKELQVMSYKILSDGPEKVYEPAKMSNKDAMDYENNGGSLIQVEGEVVEVEYGTDGTSVNQFVVKDGNGDLAKVFIDGYILSSKTGKNELSSIVKKGNMVSAVGLLYMHPEGNSDESVAVLRVRDCEEILLVKEGVNDTYYPTLADLRKEELHKLEALAESETYNEAGQAEIAQILQDAKAALNKATTSAAIRAAASDAAEKIKNVLTAAEATEIEKIQSTRFAARSKMTTLHGKKAVKVYWNEPEVNLDGYQVYRSVKRYEGYGKKPFFQTEKTSYYNNKELKTGSRYYYKVRGYREINGQTVYTQWSSKAWRTVK